MKPLMIIHTPNIMDEASRKQVIELFREVIKKDYYVLVVNDSDDKVYCEISTLTQSSPCIPS
jgi:hypothetical protein